MKAVKHLRAIAVAAGFAAGLAVSIPFIAAAWTAPTGTPPNNDVAAPLNVSSNLQEKTGPLTVDGNFIVNNSASFNGLVSYGNVLVGGSAGSNKYVNFGATSGSGGYGIWDNNGTLNFKNSGGSWASLQSIICGYVSCTGGGGGTITGVTAGTNMTGGGTSGTVTLSTVASPTFSAVTANSGGIVSTSNTNNAVSGSSEGNTGAWSGCFGSSCTGGTQTALGIYANGTSYAGDFNGPVYISGPQTVTGQATFNNGPYTSDWFRVNGTGGLYWQSYGGSVQQYDGTWVRVNPYLYVGNGYDSGGSSGAGCGGGLGGGYTFRVCGNEYVTGNTFVASRNMWMSEAARDDESQFWANSLQCPGGSVMVGMDESGGGGSPSPTGGSVDNVLCQWFN